MPDPATLWGFKLEAAEGFALWLGIRNWRREWKSEQMTREALAPVRGRMARRPSEFRKIAAIKRWLRMGRGK